jgi:hypothetical protein
MVLNMYIEGSEKTDSTTTHLPRPRNYSDCLNLTQQMSNIHNSQTVLKFRFAYNENPVLTLVIGSVLGDFIKQSQTTKKQRLQ